MDHKPHAQAPPPPWDAPAYSPEPETDLANTKEVVGECSSSAELAALLEAQVHTDDEPEAKPECAIVRCPVCGRKGSKNGAVRPNGNTPYRCNDRTVCKASFFLTPSGECLQRGDRK